MNSIDIENFANESVKKYTDKFPQIENFTDKEYLLNKIHEFVMLSTTHFIQQYPQLNQEDIKSCVSCLIEQTYNAGLSLILAKTPQNICDAILSKIAYSNFLIVTGSLNQGVTDVNTFIPDVTEAADNILKKDAVMYFYYKEISEDIAKKIVNDEELFKSLLSEYSEEGSKNEQDYDVQYYNKLNEINSEIEKEPNNSVLYYKKAMHMLDRENGDKILPEISKAIELNPNFTEAYNVRAQLYDTKGDYEKAEQDYMKMIELQPSLDVYSGYIYHLFVNKQNGYDEAENVLESLPDKFPPSASMYYQMGLIYHTIAYIKKSKGLEASEEYNKAVTYLNKTVETDSTYKEFLSETLKNIEQEMKELKA